jgi:Ca-activated chloride channel family protein
MTRPLILFTCLAVCASTQTQESVAQFKSEARLIEVYATVFDKKGKFLSGLSRDGFEILDEGTPQPITAFESSSSDLSCALLLDATGSMSAVLPRLKKAVTDFIDELRPGDAIAVYSFAEGLQKLADFTIDKSEAKRAVSRIRAFGGTALFDGMASVAGEITNRRGRKALLVFSDGADNASVLTATNAVARANKSGIPIFAVAQGDALKAKNLFKLLKETSEATGGKIYAAEDRDEIAKIFADISRQLQSFYLLAYKPPPADQTKWRSIRVLVKGQNRYEVRARQGYLP